MRWLLLVLSVAACQKKPDPRQEHMKGEIYSTRSRRVSRRWPSSIARPASGCASTIWRARARCTSRRSRRSRKSPWAGWGWASCALEERNYELAQKSYEQAAALDGKSASAQIGMGSVASLQGKYRDAADRFEQAAALDPASADAHWGAAAAWNTLGEHERARAHAKVFIALAPDSALVPRAREIAGAIALKNSAEFKFSTGDLGLNLRDVGERRRPAAVAPTRGSHYSARRYSSPEN